MDSEEKDSSLGIGFVKRFKFWILKKQDDGRVEYGQTKTISVLLIRGYIYIYIESYSGGAEI